jgi:hypothetical protein
VVFAHQRWAIEQQYQALKSELGLDHFEGRTYPGWQHHVVLTAVAHTYIQCERRRRGAATLTFPAVRAIVQDIVTALLFAAKPRYMQWMEQAKRTLQLRIRQSRIRIDELSYSERSDKQSWRLRSLPPRSSRILHSICRYRN